MFRTVIRITVCIALLTTTWRAEAELSSLATAGLFALDATPAGRPAAVASGTTGSALLDELNWVLRQDIAPSVVTRPIPAELPATKGECAKDAVQQVPPAPSSLALSLSALAGIGVIRAGRSLRKFHLGPLPDWYHTGAPLQIGHATVFDLAMTALPVRLFDRPTIDPECSHFSFVPRVLGRALSGFLVRIAPRGPPPG